MKIFLLSLYGLMFFINSYAQVPANDACSNAVYIAVDGSATNGTLLNATTSGIPSCSGGNGSNDVWYKFVAPANGIVEINLGVSTQLDGVLELFSSCDGNSSMGCRDSEYEGIDEKLVVESLISGQMYYLRVYNYSTSIPVVPTFTISVATTTIDVSNDDCGNPAALTLGVPYSGSLEGATMDGIESCYSGALVPNDDVWFSFVAPASGIVVIELSPSSGLDGVIEVFSACNETPLYCEDSKTEGENEFLTVPGLEPGQTYLLRVYEYDDVPPATFTYEVVVRNVLTNDDCSNATTLALGQTVTSSLDGATGSGTACSGNPNDDVWFSFIAPSSGAVRVDLAPSQGMDGVIELFNSCGGTRLGCKDVALTGDNEQLTTTGLVSGQTYLFRIFEFSGNAPSTKGFSITVSAAGLTPPANDECSNAAILTLGQAVNGTLANATGTSLVGCAGSADDDVWYKFVAPANGTIDISIDVNSSFDAVVELFDACNGTSIGCKDGRGSGVDERFLKAGLISGQTYYIRVFSLGASIPTSSTFSILANAMSSVAVNDECGEATPITVGCCLDGTVGNATESSLSSCSLAKKDDDVWYKFVAPASGSVNVALGLNNGFDGVLQVLDGCSGNTLFCVDDNASGEDEFTFLRNLNAGNTYYVRVFSFGGYLPDEPGFSLCVNEPNDDCVNAIQLAILSNLNDVSNDSYTLKNATVTSISGCYSSKKDVWFKFNAPSSEAILRTSSASPAVIGLEVTNGCSGASVKCDEYSALGNNNISLTGLTIGHTYYIRVSDNTSAAIDFGLGIANDGLTGVLSELSAESLNVYPNPASHELNIDLKRINGKVTSLKMINSEGQLVYSEVNVDELSRSTYTVGTESMTSGIYLIQIVLNEELYNWKVIVQH